MITRRSTYKVFASSANLGSGFDTLAVAINAYYDIAEVLIRFPGSGVVSVNYAGPYGHLISGSGGSCVIKAVFREFTKLVGEDLDAVFSVWKGIPPSKGLGSSGASASLAAYALNDLLGLNLGVNELVRIAGVGESAVAGVPHYDNVAASLIGGLVIIGHGSRELRVWRMPIDEGLRFIIAVPETITPEFKTKVMRSVIPGSVGINELIVNSSRLASLITGLMLGDAGMIAHGMRDDGVTKARIKYVPCYEVVREAAIKAGAYGLAISGAGPSVIAVVGVDGVESVVNALRTAYDECGVKAVVKPSNVAEGVKALRD